MAKLNTGRSEKAHNVDFAKGGKTPMLGGHGPGVDASLGAGDQAPGTSAHDNKGGSSDKFASGGSGKMFGYSPSVPAQGGITGPR